MTSSEDESDSTGEDSDAHDETNFATLASSLATSLPDTPTLQAAPSNLMADSEFRTEVAQSLERAFSEGHSVDNAAVELKTLRMASNVPLTRVREAVVAAIVEQIKLVDGGAAEQRKEIAGVVDRWGELIDKIGGVDAVETISVLQVPSRPFFRGECDSYCFAPGPLCVIEALALVRPDTRGTVPVGYC